MVNRLRLTGLVLGVLVPAALLAGPWSPAGPPPAGRGVPVRLAADDVAGTGVVATEAWAAAVADLMERSGLAARIEALPVQIELAQANARDEEGRTDPQVVQRIERVGQQILQPEAIRRAVQAELMQRLHPDQVAAWVRFAATPAGLAIGSAERTRQHRGAMREMARSYGPFMQALAGNPERLALIRRLNQQLRDQERQLETTLAISIAFAWAAGDEPGLSGSGEAAHEALGGLIRGARSAAPQVQEQLTYSAEVQLAWVMAGVADEHLRQWQHHLDQGGAGLYRTLSQTVLDVLRTRAAEAMAHPGSTT